MNVLDPFPKRILVIRLSSLGDVILTTLLIRRLRKRFRRAEIDMLTRQSYHSLLDGVSHLDRRIAYPESTDERRTFHKTLAQSHYDTVIDLQNNFNSRWMTNIIKPLRLHRYHRPRINRWLRMHCPVLRKRLGTPAPVALGYLDAASSLGVWDDGKGLELTPTDEWLRSAKEMLGDDFAPTYEEVLDTSPAAHKETLDTSHPTCGGEVRERHPLIISPGARHNTKMWQSEKWIELLNRAYQAGYDSQVIVGSKDEVKIAERIADGVDQKVLVLAGRTGLGELAAVISLGSVLISNDSGTMHIAEAVGTPVVALFGPTVVEFGFAPFRCQSEVVQADGLSCRPCRAHGSDRCPKGHFHCMERIDVEWVMEAVKRLTDDE